MLENCLNGRECQRMPHKGSCEERDSYGWIGIVAELPGAAIEGIHELSASGENADWHATRNYLAVRGQISADSEQSLTTSRMDAESRNNLVEDQCSARQLRNLANLLQELDWLKMRMSALNRFHEYSREGVCVGSDPFERLFSAVVENCDVSNALARDSRGHRRGMRRSSFLETFHQHFIEHAV